MSELIDILHGIAQDNQKAQNPMEIRYGTVETVSPVSIRIQDTMQRIPELAIELTSQVIGRTAKVQGGNGGSVVVCEGLDPGDKVIMLRAFGGNKYIVLSKVQ